MENNNNNNNEFVTVATKISRESAEILKAICKEKHLTLYDLMQMCCDTLIRYMDDRHQLTPAMETMIHCFESLNGWGKSFNLCDTDTKPEVGEATYFFTDAETYHHGVRAVHVYKPFMGEPVCTYNIQEIFERMFCLLLPQIYRRLRLAGVELDTNSVLETVEVLLQGQSDYEEDRVLGEIFSRAAQDDKGRDAVPSMKYKQHKSKSAYSKTFHPDVTLFDNTDINQKKE